MKKNYLLLLCATCAISLCACSNDKKTEKETESQTTEIVTEVTTVEETTIAETESDTELNTEPVTEETKRRRTEETTEETTEEITSQAVADNVSVDEASKYVGKKLSELVSDCGLYGSFETAGSCLDDENELNGMAYYTNFTVYCHSINGQTEWIIDAVE